MSQTATSQALMSQAPISQALISQDLAIFLGSALLLVGYLIFSAKTEMGTKIKWPWQK